MLSADHDTCDVPIGSAGVAISATVRVPCHCRTSMKPRNTVDRREFLIDRHFVVFETGVGSRCECHEFKAIGACRHTRESEGRWAAQELIAHRVRSIGGTLVGFSNSRQHDGSRPSKGERSRSLALQRVR